VSIAQNILKKGTHFLHIAGLTTLAIELQIQFQVLEKVKDQWNKGYAKIWQAINNFFSKHKLTPVAPNHQ